MILLNQLSTIFFSYSRNILSMQETQEVLRADEEKRGRCLDLQDYEYDDEDERLIFLDPLGWDIVSAPF